MVMPFAQSKQLKEIEVSCTLLEQTTANGNLYKSLHLAKEKTKSNHLNKIWSPKQTEWFMVSVNSLRSKSNLQTVHVLLDLSNFRNVKIRP